MYVSWECCCRTLLYAFTIWLLIYGDGRIKLTMEMYQTILAPHIVSTFLLKAAEIKLVNQVSWAIRYIP